MNFLSIFYGFFMVNNFKTYPENTDHPALNDDHYLTSVGSAASVFNASRFIWSGALDRFSYKKVYGVLLTIQIVTSATIPLISDSKVLYAMWVCLALFCEGGHFSLVPN